MNSSNFNKTKQKISEEREKGFYRLKFTKELEDDFREYFTDLSRDSLITSFLFLLVPLFILVHVVSYEITIKEFFSILTSTLLTFAKLNIPTSGMEGAFGFMLLSLIFILLLLPARKIDFVENNFQLCLSISLSLTLGLALSSLFMIDDGRFSYIFKMLLMSGFLFVYFLLYFQFFYLLLYQVICVVLLFTLSISLGWQANWVEFSALFGSISLFGLIFSYLREMKERSTFLNLLEIANQKEEYEFLHQQIERENLLKAKLSALHAAMSGEKKLIPLAQKILSDIVPKLNCNLASIYLAKEEELILLANYGTQENSRQTIPFGETLVGQVAVSKQPIQMNESPENFQTLQSGLGSIKSPAILIQPILFSDELIGVIELASIKALNEDELELLEAACRSIATALRAVAAKTEF